MEMDLNARNSKWKREEQRRRDQAKRKLQTEQLKRAAAEKARQELEAAQAQKRIERLEEAARAEERALEEQRVTGGIKYLQQLRPVPTTSDGDKITLPVSALEELNPQNAHELGVFTFELSYRAASDGSVRRTHAGVLEFVAQEGTVGLPPKVAASLCERAAGSGAAAQLPDALQVKFVRLEKGKFASLQPRGAGFGEREIDFKKILERSLKAHTTLTVGDVLFVRHGKETFEVAVAELQPEEAVNILNTDLEVALLPSEAVTKAKEIERQREEAAAAAAARALAEEAEKERRRAETMARLAPEPPLDERQQVKLVLRLPGGAQQTRRFLHEAPLGHVFDFVEALTGEDASGFQFAATFPRRVFGVGSRDRTLRDAGLNGRQEALFVESTGAQSLSASALEAADALSSDAAASVAEEGQLSQTLLPAQWEQARQTLEAALDEVRVLCVRSLDDVSCSRDISRSLVDACAQVLYSTVATPIHALEPIMPVAQSADQETKWEAQLLELEAMGFVDRTRNIQVLERYQGRLLRVVNYLSEMSASEPVADEGVVAMEE